MPDRQSQYTIFLGGWYQRTTLHLTEVYDFFHARRVQPGLDKNKIDHLHVNLNLHTVTREAGNLEFVQASTGENISIRYYEDGLYILQTEAIDIVVAKNKLEKYYQEAYKPAINYLFSLGAPVPKILANIKTLHPIVVSVKTSHPEKIDSEVSQYGEIYSKITSQGITVYKTPEYIFIASDFKDKTPIVDLMEMQIFFREFKDQLFKYLQIHRNVWEEITQIKERKTIQGSEISPLRVRLDSYQKTINLIRNRINQMGTYVHTRSSLAKEMEIEDHLKTLFQYKFEVMINTLNYIKEIWTMTIEYLSSAIQILSGLETQSTNNSIRSLQIITSIGVVSGVLTYLTRSDIPKVTPLGFVYFAILALITWLLNIFISRLYRNIRYRISIADNAKDL